MSNLDCRDTLLLGAVSGAIYVSATLTTSEYEFLQQVEERLVKHVHGVGGLNHGFYRAKKSQENLSVAGDNGGIGVIDGDLIERLLELSPTIIAEVV